MEDHAILLSVLEEIIKRAQLYQSVKPTGCPPLEPRCNPKPCPAPTPFCYLFCPKPKLLDLPLCRLAKHRLLLLLPPCPLLTPNLTLTETAKRAQLHQPMRPKNCKLFSAPPASSCYVPCPASKRLCLPLSPSLPKLTRLLPCISLKSNLSLMQAHANTFSSNLEGVIKRAPLHQTVRSKDCKLSLSTPKCSCFPEPYNPESNSDPESAFSRYLPCPLPKQLYFSLSRPQIFCLPLFLLSKTPAYLPCCTVKIYCISKYPFCSSNTATALSLFLPENLFRLPVDPLQEDECKIKQSCALFDSSCPSLKLLPRSPPKLFCLPPGHPIKPCCILKLSSFPRLSIPLFLFYSNSNWNSLHLVNRGGREGCKRDRSCPSQGSPCPTPCPPPKPPCPPQQPSCPPCPPPKPSCPPPYPPPKPSCPPPKPSCPPPCPPPKPSCPPPCPPPKPSCRQKTSRISPKTFPMIILLVPKVMCSSTCHPKDPCDKKNEKNKCKEETTCSQPCSPTKPSCPPSKQSLSCTCFLPKPICPPRCPPQSCPPPNPSSSAERCGSEQSKTTKIKYISIPPCSPPCSGISKVKEEKEYLSSRKKWQDCDDEDKSACGRKLTCSGTKKHSK